VLWPTATQAQFFLSTTNSDGSESITGYFGFPPSVLVIPDTINNLPVTSIADDAFKFKSITSLIISNNLKTIGSRAFTQCSSLTNVIVGTNLVNIGTNAFGLCGGLASITVPGSVNFPNSVTNIGPYAFQVTALKNFNTGNNLVFLGENAFGSCPLLTSVTVGDGLTSIGGGAFLGCQGLTDATFGSGVTNVGNSAFNTCLNLKAVYFKANAPTAGTYVFQTSSFAKVYYLPGTTGWGPTLGGVLIYGGAPTVLWNPQAQMGDGSFGVQNNQFGFNISGSSNLVIMVEAATNPANAIWIPVGTNTLNTFVGTNGISHFSDLNWTNYPCRFYRFRSP
jgi:hypothetical protein